MRKLNKVFAGFFVAIAFMLLLTVKSAAVVDQAIVTDEVKNITFDANYYLSAYPDLKEAFGADSTAAYNHFLNFGISEGRCAKLTFNIVYYLDSYQDLKDEFGKANYEAAYKHFIEFGASEGRSGCPIYDTIFYLSNNADVVSAFGNDYAKVYEHYAIYGVNEGRLASANFNVKCYVDKYSDLKEAFSGETKYAQGFAHYLTYGIDEKRVGTHEYQETTVEATCTTDGYILEECGCGDTIKTVLPALGHDMTKHEVVKATCKSEGNPEYWTCSNECCDGKYYADEAGETELTADEIVTPVLEHVSDDGVVTKEPTCTEAGEKTYTCTIGGEVMNTESIPALGHSMEKTEAKEPTCTEIGNNEYYTCKTCGKVFTDEAGENETTVEAQTLPADVHVLMYVPAKEATCAETGNIEYYKCTKCGATFSDNEAKEPLADVTVPKTEEHTWNEGEVTTAATCTEKGVMTYTCTVCGEAKTEEIDVIAHDMEKTEAKDATCTEAGNKAYYTCKNCGGIFEDEDGKASTTVEAQTIEALGHSYGDIEVVTGDETDNTNNYVHKHTCEVCGNVEYLDEAHDYVLNDGERKTSTIPATCTENGYDEYLCSKCNKLKLTVAKATGHNMTEVAKVEATCTENGHEAYYTCSNSCCDGKYFSDEKGTEVALDDLKIEATGHSYTEEITTPATCGVAGEKTLTCSACGDVKTEAIEALTHNMTKHEAVAATCETDGSKEYWTCSNSCCDGKYFSDENGETEVTLDDLKIAASDEYHDWKDVEDVSSIGLKAPTCEEAGVTARKCETCGDIEVSDAEALGHDYTYVVSTEDSAKHIGTCGRCNETVEEEHEYGDAIESTTYPGYYEAKCEDCGYVNYYTDSNKTNDVYVVTTTENSNADVINASADPKASLIEALDSAKVGDVVLIADDITIPNLSKEEKAVVGTENDTVERTIVISQDAKLVVLEGKTLDLGNCTLQTKEGVNLDISGKGTITSDTLINNKSYVTVAADKNSSVTVTDATIKNDSSFGIYGVESTITLNNTQMETNLACVSSNNTTGKMTLVVNDGTILTSKEDYSIYMPGAGDDVTINGGTLNGGVLMRCGTLTVNGGTLNSMTLTPDSIDDYYNRSGSGVWYGDTIAILGKTYVDASGQGRANDVTVNINGGTINCSQATRNTIKVYNLGKVEQTININVKMNADGTTPVATFTNSNTNGKIFDVVEASEINYKTDADKTAYTTYTNKVIYNGSEYNA